ncbi:MAG: amidohydrolase family protein [Ignavibacteria bacterium]|nr:amidohydrolase family protein [Ignavibacteria bacterium]MBT8383922.1 amidohydrolase family protein [Ignavibacteria bacterium]MBT8391477.1 amidohydrolase family protein [Ignavibacteria bacterium]NNJ54140.1 amidohydrolase family protein [Ignavibacteriaceae bacterium]NNL21407.1 amidohydrolase family protein [Ignavibacteriaceae bacterium]
MSKQLIIAGKIVCADEANTIFENTALEINKGKISAFIPFAEIQKENYSDVFDYPEYTLIPGFVQTHVHLCQTLFRGLAEELPLLDWLKYRIFPFENAHDTNSLRQSCKLGLNELLLSGTTTICDMGTLRYQEVVFSEMMKAGIRGFSGKCMIDQNDLMPEFKSSTNDELKDVIQLVKNYHNSNEGKIKYAFAPRFVLSCTEELLKETKEIVKDFPGSLYHTHSSENKIEVEEVRKRFRKENIEYFDSLNLLDDYTILAHCVHTNQNEKDILKENKTRVAHCPSANLKLGSGIAPIPEYLNEGISVSLGADGAPCNNNLSIFNEMRLASLVQKPIYGPEVMSALKIFRMATIDGAKALHLDEETGSIEIGKMADLVLLDLNTPMNSLDEKNVYSNVVFSSNQRNVKCVMIGGDWKVLDSQSQIYDRKEIVSDGKQELGDLLKRIK